MGDAGVPRRIAEGREAEVYAWQAGTVLRLLREPGAGARNERQRLAIEAAAAAGVRVPAVHGAVTYLERPGLVMERVDGPDLLTVIGRRPWKLLWVGRVTGETHARLHATRAPEQLPILGQAFMTRIAGSPRVPARYKGAALDLLARLPEGDRLYHGDFHPGNLLVAGDAPVVIDWTGVARSHPDADVARTVLLLRLGAPPPGAPLLVRLLASTARRALLSAYLRTYCARRPFDAASVARWELVQAIARFDDGIAEETTALEHLIERRLRQTR